MKALFEKVNGYKTYLVSGCMAVYAALGFFLGYLEPSVAGQILLEALALAGLRHAI